MNATSLFVSTSRVVLQAEEDGSSWADLHRLVPYLRQSLSCTVCSNLLIEPYTPTETSCQHHVCSSCRGDRKKLKPSCSWCKDYDSYVENVMLRILLQCYKKLCVYITSTGIYRSLLAGGSSLVELINEGAEFKDDYKSSAGLSRSAYSILPCVYSSSSSQQAHVATSATVSVSPPSSPAENPSGNEHVSSATVPTVSNGSSLYSVFNIGSKMTFKRKTVPTGKDVSNSEPAHNDDDVRKPAKSLSLGFKKPGKGVKGMRNANHGSLKTSITGPKQIARVATIGSATSVNMKRKGCRCGNATATPGKLTCCGQRCPCYVDSKACLDCRCKGCRNPHRPGGHKVRPHIPELENYQLHMSSTSDIPTIDQSTQVLSLASPSELAASNAGATVQVLGVYTTQLHPVTSVSTSLPATLLVGDESSTVMDDSSELETSDVEVDC